MRVAVYLTVMLCTHDGYAVIAAPCIRPVRQESLASDHPQPMPASWFLPPHAVAPFSARVHRPNITEGWSWVWSFPSQQNMAPSRLDYLFNFGPTTTRRLAVRTDGFGLVVASPPISTSPARIFVRDPDGSLRALTVANVERARGVSWSELARAFLVSGLPSGNTSELSLDGAIGRSMRGEYDVLADLPTVRLVGLLDHVGLRLLEPETLRSVGQIQLRSGVEALGWERLYETADPGWLYFVGAEYDYSIRLEPRGSDPRVAEIVRITKVSGTPSLFSEIVAMVHNLIVWSEREIVYGSCQRWSHALRRMIFCTPGRIGYMRAGRLVSLDPSWRSLQRYLGDVSQENLAIFVDERGGIYALDRSGMIRWLGDADDRYVSLHSARDLNRHFVSTRTSLFEIRRTGNRLSLEPILASLPFNGLVLVVASVPGLNRPVLIASDGVYELEGDVLRRIWAPQAGHEVETSGSRPPVEVPIWSGLLVSVRSNPTAPPSQIVTVTACPDGPGASPDR